MSEQRQKRLDYLKKQRASVRSRLSKKCNETNSILNSTDVASSDKKLQSAIFLDTVADISEQLSKFNIEIDELVEDLHPEAWDAEREDQYTYNDKAISYRNKIKQYLEKLTQTSSQVKDEQQQSSSSSASTAQQQIIIRNDINKVPSFSGDYKKFREWSQLFEVQVHGQPIDPIVKYKALKDALSGAAAREIAHLDFSADQYSVAWDAIKARFGRKDDAETEHIRELHKLCTMKDLHIAGKLSYFTSTLEQNVKALIALGKSYKDLTTLLTPLLINCLPKHIKQQFFREADDRESQGASDGGQTPLERLIKFLGRETDIERSISQFGLVGTSSNYGGHANRSGSGPHYKQKGPFQAQSHGRDGPNRDYSFQAGSKKLDQSCIFCKMNNHESHKCRKIMSIEERRQCMEQEHACFKCLQRDHMANKCPSQANIPKCPKCKLKHFIIMCPKSSLDRNASRSFNALGAAARQEGTGREKGATVLRTGYVWAAGDNGRIIVRIILDPGSQRSYISRDLCKRLSLRAKGREKMITYTIGGRVSGPQSLDVFELELQSRFQASNKVSVKCLSTPVITKGTLPMVANVHGLKTIADFYEGECSKSVEILIGSDYLARVHLGEERIFDDVIATLTKFGWVFNGNDPDSQEIDETYGVLSALRLAQPCTSVPRVEEITCLSTHDMAVSGAVEDSTMEDMKFLWDLETLGVDVAEEAVSDLDKELDEFFKNSIQRAADGRYTVSLPFKDNLRELGDNEGVARARLKGLLRSSDQELIASIDTEIQKYLDSNFAEAAPPRKKGELAHYLPILAVVKSAAATQAGTDTVSHEQGISASPVKKIRVVKDASARRKNEASLNDVLHQGPNMLPDILKVLLKFRSSKIAIVADIEKAFLQFKINPDHRTFLRFLWPLGISKNPKAQTREFWGTVLDFGLICSPWLHCAGIRHHLNLEMQSRPECTDLVQGVSDTFYMDDLIFGCSSELEGRETVKTMFEVFKSGCFPLAKWATNSPKLAQVISELTNVPTSSISCHDAEHKFLGIRWNQPTDQIGAFVDKAITTLSSGKATKILLLRGLAQVFDPLGVLAPVSINAKMLFQKLWKQKIDWDVELKDDNLGDYTRILDGLRAEGNLQVNRFIGCSEGDVKSQELHVFCDASLAAYGCVIYLRTTANDGTVNISLVAAKAKVVPIKGDWTIHRLELLGALLAARLYAKISKYIAGPITKVQFWCDNASVLGWVRESPSKWKQFVANRVKEIQSITEEHAWNYVASADNPADLISRGKPLEEEDCRRLWCFGPSWLREDGAPQTTHQLNAKPETDIDQLVEKEKKATCLAITAPSHAANKSVVSSILDASRFAGWTKAVRTVAYILRFTQRRKQCSGDKTTCISASDFERAEVALMRNIQQRYFRSELDSELTDIPKTSRLYQYNPFLDKEGLIRCRSRLIRADDMSYDAKCPVILPGEDDLVKLMISSVHAKKCLHSGGSAGVLHQLRSKYLVLHARRVVKKIVSRCVSCAKFNARPAAEPVPPIPGFRVDRSPPFAFTGTDFAGPVYTRDSNGSKQKGYILLFVCAVTRAVHLELVPNMTAYEFLLGLRRFFNRRPAVSKIFSDNALTFKRAAKEIEIIMKHVKGKDTQSSLAEHNITWEFITEKAPWHGAWWERMVQTVKRPLRKVLGTNCLPFLELSTVLTDVEALVNNRPLSPSPVDPNDAKALTPADLLYGYIGKQPIPEMKRFPINQTDISAIVFSNRWKLQQSILNSFWKRFKGEYLEYLRSAHMQNPVASRPIKVGDVCILKDNAPSRAFWPLCRVLALSGGERTDLRQRSCLIKMGSGQVLKRPIQLLYKLEIEQ